MNKPQVIAIDDWMVWARDESGRIVETCAEMWPEWLDEKCDPSDMETDEYRAAVLRILRHKRPQWVGTIERNTDPSDPEAIEMILSDLRDMEARQAAFIAAYK